MAFGKLIREEIKVIVDEVVNNHFLDETKYPRFDVSFPILTFYLHSDVKNNNLKNVVTYWRKCGSPN